MDRDVIIAGEAIWKNIYTVVDKIFGGCMGQSLLEGLAILPFSQIRPYKNITYRLHNKFNNFQLYGQINGKFGHITFTFRKHQAVEILHILIASLLLIMDIFLITIIYMQIWQKVIKKIDKKCFMFRQLQNTNHKFTENYAFVKSWYLQPLFY